MGKCEGLFSIHSDCSNVVDVSEVEVLVRVYSILTIIYAILDTGFSGSLYIGLKKFLEGLTEDIG